MGYRDGYVCLAMPILEDTDLSKYAKLADTQNLDRKMKIRHELFLDMIKDMPHTCNLNRDACINGNMFLETDLSNLHLKNIGISNSEIYGFHLDNSIIEESFFIHGRMKFSGKLRLNKVSMIGNLYFGKEARLIDNSLIFNSTIWDSNISAFKNCKFENVNFINCDIKQFINCDMNGVILNNHELYSRVKDCVNVPQIYKINHDIEIIALGDKRFHIRIKNQTSGRIDLKSDKSIVKQSGERIERLYKKYKPLFDAIDFEIVPYEYDDSYIICDGVNDE